MKRARATARRGTVPEVTVGITSRTKRAAAEQRRSMEPAGKSGPTKKSPRSGAKLSSKKRHPAAT
jgi:hypothetical protein